MNLDSKLGKILQKRETRIKIIICFVILGIFLLLRFYNIHHRVIFDWDQERDAWQIYDLFINHKPTLIGPRVVGPNGFFLTPYYVYLLAPFYLVTKLHPYGSILFLFTYNLAFFAGGLWIIKKLFSFKHAIFFMVFWTFNSVLAIYDTTPWNPLLLPLGVLLIWYLQNRVYENSSMKSVGMLGAVLSLSMSIHFQFIFLIIQTLAFGLLKKPKVNANNFKKGIVFLLAFLLPFAPLAIFDLRHDFINSGLFINFFLHPEIHYGASYTTWLQVWANFLQPLVFIKSVPLSSAIYIVVFGMLVFLAKKKTGYIKNFYISSIVLWLSMPVFFTLYKNRPSEYYFTFMYPYLFIAVIDFLITIKKQRLLYAIALLLLIFNIREMRYNMLAGDYTLYYKDLAIKTMKPYVEGKKFNVSFDLGQRGDSGFKYLMKYHDVNPSGKSEDPLVQLRIPARATDIYSNTIGIALPENLTPQ